MNHLSIRIESLQRQKLSFEQASEQLQNAQITLSYMQNFPFSMDANTRYELNQIQKQMNRLKQRMIMIEGYVKDSAYAYGTMEERLRKQALLLDKQVQNRSPIYNQADGKPISQSQRGMMKQGKRIATQGIRDAPDQWQLNWMNTSITSNEHLLHKQNFRALLNDGMRADLAWKLQVMSLSGSITNGHYREHAELGVGEVELSGSMHAVLFDDEYHIKPQFDVEVSASVAAVSGLIQLDWQNDFAATQALVKGEVGAVYANGEAHISQKEVTLTGEVGMAVASGEISGVLKLWGVTITLSAEGELGGVGIGGTLSASADSFELGAKFSCLLGTGLNLKIDW